MTIVDAGLQHDRTLPAEATALDPWASPLGPRVGSDAVPLPQCTSPLRRILKHPRLMHYNRLIVAVVVVNLLVLGYGITAGNWWSGGSTSLRTISAIAQANLVFAIVPRQQWMINFVGWLSTRPSTKWPLKARWVLGKYYHLGGLHVGSAIAGTVWYFVFLVSLSLDRWRGVAGVSTANVIVSGFIIELFVVMALLATPSRRTSNHDRFEVTHRFCAWIALALVWVNTVMFVDGQSGDGSLSAAMAGSPTVWLLTVSTVCALWPWLLLRKVPITVERPSSHVAIVKMDHGVTPPIGTTRPISRKPFVGWHPFANVPAADGESGYRMTISRAGDWTSEFIDDPPEHVWVRGLPAVGVANVKRLFSKVVFVVTGSGIGPALGHLLSAESPSRLVWITRDPRLTYGNGLVDEVMRAQPDATIWNSDESGKPDVLRLAYNAYVESGAEAVICISNKTVTWRVVEGLERRGIPAFGPIWDS